MTENNSVVDQLTQIKAPLLIIALIIFLLEINYDNGKYFWSEEGDPNHNSKSNSTKTHIENCSLFLSQNESQFFQERQEIYKQRRLIVDEACRKYFGKNKTVNILGW